MLGSFNKHIHQAVMAILDILPGIEVVVCVDDKPLAEIATDNDDIQHENSVVIRHQQGRTITKYIESTTGKKFTIYIKASDPYALQDTDLIFDVEVDGNFVKAPLLLRGDYETKFWEDEVDGPVIFVGEEPIVRPMKFAAIKTSQYAVLTSSYAR